MATFSGDQIFSNHLESVNMNLQAKLGYLDHPRRLQLQYGVLHGLLLSILSTPEAVKVYQYSL